MFLAGELLSRHPAPFYSYGDFYDLSVIATLYLSRHRLLIRGFLRFIGDCHALSLSPYAAHTGIFEVCR